MLKLEIFFIFNILILLSEYNSIDEFNSITNLISLENFNFLPSEFKLCPSSQILNDNDNSEVCGFLDRSRYTCDNIKNNCQFTFQNKNIANSNRGIIGYLNGNCKDFELNNLIKPKNDDDPTNLIELFDISFNNLNGRKCPINIELKEYKENIPIVGNFENVYVENKFYYKIRIKFENIYDACKNPGIISFDLSFNPLESLFENGSSSLYPDNLIIDNINNCLLDKKYVCGFDGDKFKTYDNTCFACLNKQILGYYEGECKDPNKIEDIFDEYFCVFSDRNNKDSSKCNKYITDSYPFVCGYSKYSKMTIYYNTRLDACMNYSIYKVISGLCPHHEEYFKGIKSFSCKDLQIEKYLIKITAVCGISPEYGLQSSHSIRSACENGAIVVYEKACPMF